MSNVKFSQLANQATLADNTIIPTVNLGTNFTVTAANLKAYTSNVTTLTASGNISGNYILGNGSQLTGIVSSYGNSNVTTLLASFGSNTISTTGNVTAAYVLGNGSQLTGLPATYGNSNVTTLLAAFGSNTVSTTGNVTAGYFVGDGSLLTGLPASYSNANVTTLLASFGSNTISTTGNVTAGYVVGNGSLLTNITGANVTGTVANATFATSANSATTATTASSATTATTAGTVTTAAQPNITSVGTLTVVNTTGNVSATGNISGQFFIGNGSQLTGVVAASTYSNANVSAFMANFGSNTIFTSGNITGGNLSTGGTLSVVGTTTTGPINAGGAYNGTSINTTGNITAGNANPNVGLRAGTISASGNVTLSGNLVAYVELTTSQGNTSTSFTPIYSNGIVQKITATANFTLQAPSGMAIGQNITLIITQDATGSRLITPNGAYKFAYGVKTLSTAANSIDMLSIFYDGSNYLCNLVKGYVV